MPEAPTVDPLPGSVSVITLAVSGTKAEGTSLWLQRELDADATQVTPVDDETTWQTTISLVQGANTFVVFATDSKERFSPRVGPFIVNFDTVSPAAPTVDVPTTPTSNANATLTGNRDTDADVCVRVDQAPTCTEVAPIDATAPFTTDVTLNGGTNTFCFRSADAAGNQSSETCVDIMRLGAPTVVFENPSDGANIGGVSVDVEVLVTVGSNAGEAINTVEICIDGGGCKLPAGSAGRYQTTLDYSGFSGDSAHTISATATNVAGTSSTASINVTYRVPTIEIISDDTVPGHSQAVASTVGADGVLHAVWSDECSFFAGCTIANGSLPYDVFYRSYLPGTGWGNITSLSDHSSDDDSQSPTVAVDAGGNIHVAWSDTGTIDAADSDVSSDIVTRVIGSSGTTTPTIAIDHNSDQDSEPILAAAPDGSVHVVWERNLVSGSDDLDIYHARWVPDSVGSATGTWASATLISDDAAPGRSENPQIVIDTNSNAWIVWQETGAIAGSGVSLDEPDIFLRSISATGTLGSLVLVSDYPPDSVSRNPMIATSSDDALHIAWIDNADINDANLGQAGTDNDIWYRSYDATGGSLSSYRLLSDSAAGANTPAIVAKGDGTAVVAWVELVSGNGEVLMRPVRTGLIGAQRIVSEGTDDLSISPTLSIDASDNLHVGWEDDSTLAPATDTARPATVFDPGPDHDVFWKIFGPGDGWATVP